MSSKVVYDPIHGSITIDGVFRELMDRHEIQRLRQIKQLGLGCVVFPGANHSRFEHSLGVYHLASRMSDYIGLGDEDSDAVRAAAMLHDICHPPFSHTMESVMEDIIGLDHMELSKRLIFGEVPTFMKRDERYFDEMGTIAELLENNGVSAEAVCDLIINPLSDTRNLDTFMPGPNNQAFFSSMDFAHQIIHGPVDADQMDYLMRDAHYTGVTHGAIDIERILTQLSVFNNKIVVKKSGITATEGLMVARSLMYSTVYYHKTVKIVEAMLRRAVEMSDIDLSEIYLMTDADLIQSLLSAGGRSADMVRDVLNRRLYKKACILYSTEVSEDDRAQFVRYTSKDKRRQLEADIAKDAGVDPSDVIVDIPSESTLLSKLKIGKTDVSVMDGDKVKSISRYSSISKSLQARDSIDWIMMVSAPEGCSSAVGDATRRIFNL